MPTLSCTSFLTFPSSMLISPIVLLAYGYDAVPRLCIHVKTAIRDCTATQSLGQIYTAKLDYDGWYV